MYMHVYNKDTSFLPVSCNYGLHIWGVGGGGEFFIFTNKTGKIYRQTCYFLLGNSPFGGGGGGEFFIFTYMLLSSG